MCNDGCICKGTGRIVAAHLLAAGSRIAALPALILSIAICLPLAAQISSPAGGSPFGWRMDEFDIMNGRFRTGETGMGFFNQTPPASAREQKVSVDELRHPMTEKARRVLAKAWGYAQRGEHSRAIATLREGMAKVRALVPYAHGLLGIEYLRTGRNNEAVPELAEAAGLFPHDPAAHSNLALSLCVTGQLENAEQEARVALYLDPQLDSAREIVRMIEESKAGLPRRN